MEFQTLCYIVFKPVVVSILSCKSLCISVLKTNFAFTLASSEQLTCWSPIMLHSANLFIFILIVSILFLWYCKDICLMRFIISHINSGLRPNNGLIIEYHKFIFLIYMLLTCSGTIFPFLLCRYRPDVHLVWA